MKQTLIAVILLLFVLPPPARAQSSLSDEVQVQYLGPMIVERAERTVRKADAMARKLMTKHKPELAEQLKEAYYVERLILEGTYHWAAVAVRLKDKALRIRKGAKARVYVNGRVVESVCVMIPCDVYRTKSMTVDSRKRDVMLSRRTAVMYVTDKEGWWPDENGEVLGIDLPFEEPIEGAEWVGFEGVELVGK